VTKQDHAGKLLGEVTGLCNCLKQHIAGLGLANCRVLDTCCVASCIPTADLQTRVSALKEVTAKDHIHFTVEGYANVAKQVLSTRNPPQTTPTQRLDAKKYYSEALLVPTLLLVPHAMHEVITRLTALCITIRTDVSKQHPPSPEHQCSNGFGLM
jgi:hypothetical protein